MKQEVICVTSAESSATLAPLSRSNRMPHPLSSSIEQLVRPYIDGRRFTSPDEVLLFALRVFGEFEKRYRDDLGDRLKRAFDDMSSTGGVTLESGDELNVFFDDIMLAGRNASQQQ